MEKESIPNLEVVSDDPEVRRNEADLILEALKCVCEDEFSRRETEFIENMWGAEFVSKGQLNWLRKIRDRKTIL